MFINDNKIDFSYYYYQNCSSGRQNRTYFAKWISDSFIAEYYIYYNNKIFGGLAAADYYPISRIHSNDEKNNYYTRRFSNIALGDYDSEIYYLDNNSYIRGEIETTEGETYSN